jgi:hypothetical protein
VVWSEQTGSTASLLLLLLLMMLRASRSNVEATRKDEVSPRVTGRQERVVQVSQSIGLESSAACALAGSEVGQHVIRWTVRARQKYSHAVALLSPSSRISCAMLKIVSGEESMLSLVV